MTDPFQKLYDDLAARKREADAIGPYTGGNGRIDRAVELIKSGDFPTGGTLVDVGGATGNLGYALRDLYKERWTVDISVDCREPAESKGNRFICSNVDVDGLSGLDKREGEVDLIVALDFIEHILDPQKFASECHRLLRPGGMVLINTPNIQYWRHIESLLVRGIFPHTSGDPEVYHGGHVAFYNFQDMKNIFSSFVHPKMHTEGLTADPPPPIYTTMSRISALQFSYADLIFSCAKS